MVSLIQSASRDHRRKVVRKVGEKELSRRTKVDQKDYLKVYYLESVLSGAYECPTCV